jgi:hypothetical protein
MGEMSELFGLAIFLKSFWLRLCPREKEDMALFNMCDIIVFWGKYLSFSPSWVIPSQRDQIYLG